MVFTWLKRLRVLVLGASRVELARAHATELARANAHLRTTTELIRQTLASVDETFLLLAPDGVCFASPSPDAARVFGVEPEGHALHELLDVAPHERADLADWLRLLGRGDVAFEVVRDLGPRHFTNYQTGLTYRVRYFPMRVDGRLENIIVTLLDITESQRARAAREVAETRTNFILNVATHPAAFRRFVTGIDELAGRAADLPGDELRRELHTFKGTAGVFFVPPLVRVIHELELELNVASDSERPLVLARLRTELPRVLREFLDDRRALLRQLRALETDVLNVSPAVLARARRACDAASLTQFDAIVTRLRARDLGEILAGFETHVAALGDRLGKAARLELERGPETCALLNDRYDAVLTALVHLFNNAVDHGLEDAPTRADLGKDVTGVVRVTVARVALDGRDALEIRVADDGRGIDPVALRASLARRGRAVDALTDHDLLRGVFELGVSTRTEATDVSGLGVGLSGLDELVRRHGGTLDVASHPGLGTTFTLRLPAPADVVWFADAADQPAAHAA